MIIVLYAMEEEVVGLHTLLSNIKIAPHPWAATEIGELDGEQILLAKCGVGKVFAAITIQSLIIEYRPRLVLLCGISGGLHPDYKRGDLVFGTHFVQHDMSAESIGFLPGQIPFTDYRVIESPPILIEKLSAFSLEDAQVYFGRIGSGDQFISGNVGTEIRAKFDVDVVDMESAAVAFVCMLNNTPFIIARTISDGANQDASNDFHSFLPKAANHVSQLLPYIRHNCLEKSAQG
jgi:5'-methylthioadenosine/S-adenosylhomocysteine nucleosidase